MILTNSEFQINFNSRKAIKGLEIISNLYFLLWVVERIKSLIWNNLLVITSKYLKNSDLQISFDFLVSFIGLFKMQSFFLKLLLYHWWFILILRNDLAENFLSSIYLFTVPHLLGLNARINKIILILLLGSKFLK